MKVRFEESHYARPRTKKRYLHADFSIRRMHTMFVEENFPVKYGTVEEKNIPPEKFDCGTKYRFYFDHFKKNFHYGCGTLRTDVCGECEELKVKIGIPKNKDIRQRREVKLKLHKKRRSIVIIV